MCKDGHLCIFPRDKLAVEPDEFAALCFHASIGAVFGAGL
jgi:hypothetical protein